VALAGTASAEDGEVDISGRVFVRSSSVKIQDARADWRSDLGIASARLVANYRLENTLKTQVEVELVDGDIELKDAYIRYRPIVELSFQVGRFKRPISPLSMEGVWRLPLVERGLLNDRLTAGSVDVRFPFGGRTDGATVEYRPQLPLEPRFTVGVFNSRLSESNLEVAGFDAGAPDFEDVFGRVSIEVIDDLRLGATLAAYQRVRNTDGDINHAGVGGVDVVYKHKYGRAWLEAFYGRTPFIDPVDGRVRGAMWAVRSLVAPRIDRIIDVPVDRLEPFVSVTVFEPSTIVRKSRAIQAGGGVSVKLIKQLKAQVEYVYLNTELQFPIASLHRLFFQVGSKF